MEENLLGEGCQRRQGGFTSKHPTDQRNKTAFLSDVQIVFYWGDHLDLIKPTLSCPEKLVALGYFGLCGM